MYEKALHSRYALFMNTGAPMESIQEMDLFDYWGLQEFLVESDTKSTKGGIVPLKESQKDMIKKFKEKEKR